MSDRCFDVRSKARAILAELAAGKETPVELARSPAAADGAITVALTTEHGVVRAADIAFHLTDWADDAAFLLALQLFPDRFTSEEIREGVLDFLIHVPNHVAAAAHLAGWPLRDLFEVGLTIDT